MVDATRFDAVTPLREAPSLVRFAGLVLDLDACMLARESGEAISLTRGESAVLKMFVARPGRVISRDSLLNAFADRRFEPFDRSVDVLVGKLRRKIEPDPKRPRLIVTVPGEGYRFDGLRLRRRRSQNGTQTPPLSATRRQSRRAHPRGRSRRPKPRRARRNGAISQRSPLNLYGPRGTRRTIQRTCASSSTRSVA
jgi:DNA-binding winged helix-turn-helix (wHTH) protein